MSDTVGSRDASRCKSFELADKSFEVTYLPALWRVKAGDRVAESRILDEALKWALGKEQVLGRSAALVGLTIDILSWALDPHPQTNSAKPHSD